MKSIIVYCSRNGKNFVSGTIRNLEKGNGARLVEIICQDHHCDVFQIEPVHE